MEVLIEKSNKKKLTVQITPIKFNENNITAFVFRFIEIILTKKKKYFDLKNYIPNIIKI